MKPATSGDHVGERLTALIEPVAMRLAVTILLLATAVPSLFMG